MRPEFVLACLGLSLQATALADHILNNAMFWWSSNGTSDNKITESGAGEANVSPKQPATGGYGLPDDRALEPLNLPPEPSVKTSPPAPTPRRPPAPMPGRASPKVVGEAAQVERLDKQWLLHVLDEHMSKMQESFNELQRNVGERFEAIESDVAQARSTISANAGAVKRLGLACTNLDTEIKQTKAHAKSSVAKLAHSHPVPSQASSDWKKDMHDALQFVQESTQTRVEDVAQVQRKLTAFVRDSMRKAKQEVHTMNQKLLSQSISASLFSLKAGEMSNWQRQHSISTLKRKQTAMQSHAEQASEISDAEFELWLTDGQEDSASSRAEEPSQEELQSAELEIEKLVDEATSVAAPEKSISMEARELPTEHAKKQGDSPQDVPVVDRWQLQSLVQEFASSEMQGLDAKMTLLSLSSNLFCIKSIDLSKPVRERCVNLLESQLKAIKARTGHLGNFSCFTFASDAALEALDSETRLLESSHDASLAASSAAEESVGRQKEDDDYTVPPEIEDPVCTKYTRPSQSMKL